MRCMMVHSVSTREVGSLPPSLSRACAGHRGEVKSENKRPVCDRMMLTMPCRRRADYEDISDSHLLEMLHRGFVFSDLDDKLRQGLFSYPQVILEFCSSRTKELNNSSR